MGYLFARCLASKQPLLFYTTFRNVWAVIDGKIGWMPALHFNEQYIPETTTRPWMLIDSNAKSSGPPNSVTVWTQMFLVQATSPNVRAYEEWAVRAQPLKYYVQPGQLADLRKVYVYLLEQTRRI